jgi:hypothetical protein
MWEGARGRTFVIVRRLGKRFRLPSGLPVENRAGGAVVEGQEFTGLVVEAVVGSQASW